MHESPVTDLLQPRFETHPPMLLAGVIERYNTQNTNGIPNQWQRFGPMIPKISGRASTAAYGALYNFQDNDFDYLCAVEIDISSGGGHVPDTLKTLSIPASKYVVFQHSGHIAEMQSFCTTIWNRWFPESGHTPLDAPMLERYGPEFDPATGTGGFEIWIPIEA